MNPIVTLLLGLAFGAYQAEAIRKIVPVLDPGV